MSLQLPPEKIRFMNETDEKFIEIGLHNVNLMREYGFSETSRVLDIGSGYGRLAYAVNACFPDFKGEYVGVDILEKHVGWCRDAIEKNLKNFFFKHIDIKNERYNPGGKIENCGFRFDLESSRFDYAVLFSVFTHMYEADIMTYLGEIERMLKSEGVCIATFFLYDDDRLAAVNSRDKGITLHHEINEYNRYFNENDPLHAIAFDIRYVKERVRAMGFDVLDCVFGHWAGGKSLHYQDVMVLGKPSKRGEG